LLVHLSGLQARPGPSRTDDEHNKHRTSQNKNTHKTELMTMPTPPAYRQLSLVLITIFLTLCLPNSTHAAFNETDCLSCVKADEATEKSINSTSTYCEVGVGTGTYQCFPIGDDLNLCTNATTNYFDFQCNGDLEDAIKGFKGFVIGFIILNVILIVVCCLAITGGIAACIYCCVRSGNNNNNNGSRGVGGGPQAHQQYPPPPQQQQPMLVVPGTVAKETNLPAHTGGRGIAESAVI
jgi:hypothetical protein